MARAKAYQSAIAAGGTAPISTSRVTPPATATTKARNSTPKMSNRFCTASAPPLNAKAKVPTASISDRSEAPGKSAAALGALDGRGDQGARLLDAAPAQQLDPLAGLEVLVVDEEMLDLLARDLRQVVIALHADIALG